MNRISNTLLRKAFLLSAIFFLTVLFSCKKDGKLSPDFDNGNLAISYIDTFSIVTSVEREDSLRTDGLALNMLGLYHDPIFGRVSSSIYTQVVLNGVNVNFGSAQIDSAVLTLDYAGRYGDTTTNSSLNIKVFELDEALSLGTDYYSNSITNHKPTPEATIDFTPNLLPDSFNIGFDTINRKSHLRIKLTDAFGQSILDASPLSNDASFTDFMKGFYITATNTVNDLGTNLGDGYISYFDMNSELSTLTLYYDTFYSYSFTINTSAEKYSRFTHNYTGKDVEKHLNNDGSKNALRTYVSSMAGVKTKIELPTIQDLKKDGPVVINKAEIIFTVESGSDLPYDPIDETLYLVGIDADGNQIVLADNNSIIESDPTHFGGTYDDNTESYSFNITRHLHQVLNSNNPDYGMYLVSRGAKTEANRVVLGSGDKNSAYKMRLEVTYSKI